MKAETDFPILAAMMRKGTILVIAFLFALPMFAQDNSIGFLLGTSEYFDDGFSFDFGADVQEFWYSRDLQAGTIFRLKVGQSDFDVEDDDSDLPRGSYEVEYALALIEYRFHEVYGSTTIFAGPGAYQQDSGGQEETDFGVSAGVTADFPLTRRSGLLLEAAYHWVNAEQEYEFVTIGGGLRVSF